MFCYCVYNILLEVYMEAKDFLIILLLIVIVGAVLFGSVGNFLGSIIGVMSGVDNVVESSEGYVYKGGYISDVQGLSNTNTNTKTVGTNSSSGASGVSGQSNVAGSSSQSSSHASSQKSSSSDVQYEDYQRDYETGMLDDLGNPIYLSIVSTSGGQMDPGIYQVYWSAAGPINQTKIG